MRLWAGLLAAIACVACAGPSEPVPPYLHNRIDYAAFRDRHPQLLEPNYLPFMTERVRVEEPVALWARWLGRDVPPPRDYLVFCHWSEESFPLSVYVEPPKIPEEGARGRSPAAYVAAVDRALGLWESALEGWVSFERVDSARRADVVLHLTAEGESTEAPGIQVLGSTTLGGACRYRGGDPATGRLDLAFAVRELRVHVADGFGLLLPDQVEKIALHEIGHALGMRGHSPIPADLMYRVVRDRLPRGELGTEDVNSFVSLYSVPGGTIYLPLDASPGAPPDSGAPEGPPRLALAPHVDPRLGYEIQLPGGWTSLDTGNGVVAVDGTTWDYVVSLQVTVRDYPDAEAYLSRYGGWHLGRGRMLGRPLEVAGRYPGVRFLLASDDDHAEELLVLESGDGRVVVVVWDCPLEVRQAWLPWLEASLATLELRAPHGPEPDRDYEIRE